MMQAAEEIRISDHKVKPLVHGSTTFRSLYDFQTTEEDLERAHLELGETENIKNSSLVALKKKCYGDREMIHNTSDQFLLSYLRYTKFKVNKAFGMLRRLGRLRKDHPEIFDLPSDLERLLNMNVSTYMPYRNEQGSIVIWADFRNWNIEEMSPIDFLKVEVAIGDLYSMNPGCQISGLVQVWDIRGWSAAHFRSLIKPSNLSTMLSILQETYPWRVKRIIIIHSNTFLRAVHNKLRCVIKKKIADRVVFLGSDINELHQYLNPVLYPKEYGGSIENHGSDQRDFILENMPFMKYQRSFKFIQ